MPFFNLGLFGDDWLAIFRYSYYLDAPKHLGPYSTEYFNIFKYLLNAYGSQDTIMAFLYKAFGSDSNIYFLLSYTLRVIAALSLYFPASLLTKSKRAAWFAVFFFLFSSVGISASSWVFNMPSYISIIFFSFMLFFSLKYFQNSEQFLNFGKKIKTLLLIYLFFALTFLATPIRAHGLIPFLIFFEILMALFTKRWNFIDSGLKISGFFVVYFLIYLLGFKETISGSPASGLLIGLKHSFQLISSGNFDFLFYPIATLGNIVVPDAFQPQGWRIENAGQYLFRIFLPIFFFYIVILFVAKHTISNLKTKSFYTGILLGTIWAILSLILLKINPLVLANANNASALLIGGYLLILVLNLFLYLKAETPLKGGLLIALGWTIISNLYPWWQANTSAIFPTSHRYLIISGVGISLLLAKIISLGKNRQSMLILLFIAVILQISHASYIKLFLAVEYTTRNKETTKKIWSQMPYIPQVGKTSEPLIFYFQEDDTNEPILRNSVTFGFPPHMAILYKISEEERIPQPMSDWKEVVSAVSDGKSIGKDKPISIESVYAFQLLGKDNLVNITGQTRQKLQELLSNP
ncbi:hypothetical protein HYU45_02535 [Candidatus Daviesbacteria bacterium]|nr:hypothetical protein [Candidatus Daviesbacteria bacterium]